MINAASVVISSLLRSAIQQRDIPTVSFTSISTQTCYAGRSVIQGLFMMTYLCTGDRWCRLCTCCVGCSGVHGLFMMTYLCTGDRWCSLCTGCAGRSGVHRLFMVTYLCTGDRWCRLHRLCWLFRCTWIVHGDLPVYSCQVMQTLHRLCWPFRCTWTVHNDLPV